MAGLVVPAAIRRHRHAIAPRLEPAPKRASELTEGTPGCSFLHSAVLGLDELYSRDDGKKWLLVPPSAACNPRLADLDAVTTARGFPQPA